MQSYRLLLAAVLLLHGVDWTVSYNRTSTDYYSSSTYNSSTSDELTSDETTTVALTSTTPPPTTSTGVTTTITSPSTTPNITTTARNNATTTINASSASTPPVNVSMTPPANVSMTPPANVSMTPPANVSMTPPSNTSQGPTPPPKIGNIILTPNQKVFMDQLNSASSAYNLNIVPPEIVLMLLQLLEKATPLQQNLIINITVGSNLQAILQNDSYSVLIPGFIYPLFKATTITAYTTQLNTDVRKLDESFSVCMKMFNDRVPLDLMSTVASWFGNKSCQDVFNAKGFIPPLDGSQSLDILQDLITKNGGTFSAWNYTTAVKPNWKFIVQVLNPQQIQAFNSFFPQLNADGLLSPNDVDDDFIRRQISNAMVAQAPNKANWTSADIAKNMDAIGNLPPGDLRAIPADALKNMNGDNLRSLAQGLDPDQKRAVGEQVLKGFSSGGGLANISASNLGNIVGFIMGDANAIKQINPDNLIDALQNTELDARGIALFGARLKESAAFRNLSAISADTLKNASQMIAGMGLDTIKQFPPSQVLAAIGTLKNVQFKQDSERKVLVDAYMTGKTFNALNASDLITMGPLLKGASSSQLNALPASNLASAVASGAFATTEFSTAQARTLASKLVTPGTCPSVSTLNNLGVNLPTAIEYTALQNCSASDLLLTATVEQSFVNYVNTLQAQLLWSKVKIAYGAVGGTDYVATNMEVLGLIFTLGISAADILALSDTAGDLLDQISLLNANESLLSVEQSKAAANRLRSYYGGFASASDVTNITSADIAKFGKFLKHFSLAELSRLPAAAVPSAIQAIGTSTLYIIDKAQLQVLLTFALKNVVNSTGTIVDRSTTARLTSDDLATLNDLMCELSASQLQNLDGSALDSYSLRLAKCCLLPANAQALLTAIRNTRPIFLNSTSSSYMLQAGPILGYMSAADQGGLSRPMLGSIAGDLVSSVELHWDNCLNRVYAGFFDEVPDDQVSIDDGSMYDVLGLSIAGLTYSARRRRATTGTLTCTDVQQLNTVTEVLTVAQISAMDSTEFSNCLETLGNEFEWTADQVTGFAAKAVAVLGSPANWTDTQITAAGSACAGLSATDFKSLKFSSLSALASVGRFGNLMTAEKLSAAFSSYVTLVKSNNAATINSAELSSMGDVACGAGTADIQKIPPSVYYGAASSIGALSTCLTAQLEQYAVLATSASAFGDPSTWSIATVGSVGVVVGGLTDTQLAALPANQISAITPAALRSIPPARFAKFSAAQFGGMTALQLQSISSEQQSALSASQLNALSTLGGTVKVPIPTDPGSGAGFNWPNPVTLLLVIMAFLVVC